MEAHAGTITIGVGESPKRRRFLSELRTTLRRKRIERAERAHTMRMNGVGVRSLPGSEHTHLIHRPRGF